MNHPLPHTPTNAAAIREVQIELTEFCDSDCDFCINRASFAKHGRSKHGLSTQVVQRVLSWIADAGIERVRFTGGEPLLRKDLVALANFAQALGLTTGVNTNGHLVGRDADFLDAFDFVLLSFVSTRAPITNRVFGRPDAHARKLDALKHLRDHPNLWVSTVLQCDNIEDLPAIGRLLDAHDVKHWVLLRPEPNGMSSDTGHFGHSEVKHLLGIQSQLAALRLTVSLGNSVPVCAVADPHDQAVIATLLNTGDGGLVSEGRSKLVVDPSGNVLAHYGIDVPLGAAFEQFDRLWAHPFARMLRSTSLLPRECRQCEYLPTCLGGSRIAAKAASGSYGARDPLMTR